MPLISVKNVHKEYALGNTQSQALKNVNLEIEQGERVCLMGPSGSGKSTLLNLLGGIDFPGGGEVKIQDCNLKTMGDGKLSEFRNRTMGFVFQNFNLIPVFSVFENVEYPLLLQRKSAAERKNRVEALLRQVGLFEMRHRSPENLSGGQRQRVAIARALVCAPQLIVADEPTSALDHATGKAVMDLLVEMNRAADTTLVFATHDPAVSEYADRIVHMLDGEIISDKRRKGKR